MAKGKRNGDSVAGYFRGVFDQHPEWLEGRSNEAVLDQWLADHPGNTEVPGKVKQNLQNIKSVLRKAKRKRKGGPPKKAAAGAPAAGPAAVVQVVQLVTGSPLEGLEIAIDDCMVMARGIDPEGLQNVISHLRRARNAVVWMQGQ